jgi:hypothetical protein
MAVSFKGARGLGMRRRMSYGRAIRGEVWGRPRKR